MPRRKIKITDIKVTSYHYIVVYQDVDDTGVVTEGIQSLVIKKRDLPGFKKSRIADILYNYLQESGPIPVTVDPTEESELYAALNSTLEINEADDTQIYLDLAIDKAPNGAYGFASLSLSSSPAVLKVRALKRASKTLDLASSNALWAEVVRGMSHITDPTISLSSGTAAFELTCTEPGIIEVSVGDEAGELDIRYIKLQWLP